MIDILKSKIQWESNKLKKINIVREFLQILILKSISDAWFFANISFLWWTALRIVYKLRRYSEDLDFSLISNNWYDFTKLLKKIKSDLNKRWFFVDINMKDKVVQSSFINFENILQELWLSNINNQKLSIKLEIDTNPPEWWNIEKIIINDQFLFAIQVFDLPSLMAWKLHAILFRWFTKWRDRYDLLRYLTKWIIPNEVLFTNACKQSKHIYKPNSRKDLLIEKTNNTNFEQVKQDLKPFVFEESELQLLNRETFLQKILQNS